MAKFFARKALMRPTNKRVTELIEEYTKKDKLHVLEIAAFFGAMQEYQLRGCTEHICLNFVMLQRLFLFRLQYV